MSMNNYEIIKYKHNLHSFINKWGSPRLEYKNGVDPDLQLFYLLINGRTFHLSPIQSQEDISGISTTGGGENVRALQLLSNGWTKQGMLSLEAIALWLDTNSLIGSLFLIQSRTFSCLPAPSYPFMDTQTSTVRAYIKIKIIYKCVFIIIFCFNSIFFHFYLDRYLS